MIKNYKRVLIFIILLTFIYLIICNNKRKSKFRDEQKKFEEITIGITKDSVLVILGEPDQIVYSIDSQFCYYYYFTKNKIGWSTMPYVEFDTSQHVINKLYGNGD